MSNTYLIVGLGNPGREYHKNRHNVGFMQLDALAEELNTRFTRLESRALITKTNYRDHRLILVKPQTYMNLSGLAVESLVRFYKIELDNLLIAYDDVDIPFGYLRMKPKGGAAGQKGMLSIIDRLGTQEFPRLRIGVDRPPGKMLASAYVLQDFSKSEQDELPFIMRRGVDAILTYITTGIDATMNLFNSKLTDGEND